MSWGTGYQNESKMMVIDSKSNSSILTIDITELKLYLFLFSIFRLGGINYSQSKDEMIVNKTTSFRADYVHLHLNAYFYFQIYDQFHVEIIV